MMRMGTGMLALLAPLQLVIGDLHGLNTLEYQPAKVAAMEGHWDGSKPVDMILFAVPDEDQERNHATVAIPKIGSLILTHDLEGRIQGLKDFPPEERPPVALVFYSFRVMVGIGLILIILGIAGAVLWWRGRLFTTQWYLRTMRYAWPLGFIAILTGWITTESGRQPYTVQGILPTANAASPVSTASVATSLVAFVIIYSVVFSIGVYYIYRLMLHGPHGASIQPVQPPEGLPNRPLSTAQDDIREARTEEPVP